MHARTVARAAVVSVVAATVLMGGAASALACGGLIAPNGTISLTRTTTLAAYHRGVEHYLTSFSYAGKVEGSLGSITPLPGVPTKIIKGGDWTLQRLAIEVQPVVPGPVFAAAGAVAEDAARVLMRAKVDSLDITVLQGGAVAVGNWAREHGFFLPPDAPEVLAFYADRSPIFMATRFNTQRAAAQGLAEGEGTPVHVVIPTPEPVGAAADPVARPLAAGPDPGRRVPADRSEAVDAAAGARAHRQPGPAGHRAGAQRAGVARR